MSSFPPATLLVVLVLCVLYTMDSSSWIVTELRHFRVCCLPWMQAGPNCQPEPNGISVGSHWRYKNFCIYFVAYPVTSLYCCYGTLSSRAFRPHFLAVKCRDLTELRIIKLLILMMVLDSVPHATPLYTSALYTSYK